MGRGVVETGGKTVQTEETSKPRPVKRSLTDRILALCASGRFGVREAIAAALKRSVNRTDRLLDSKSGKEPDNGCCGHPNEQAD